MAQGLYASGPPHSQTPCRCAQPIGASEHGSAGEQGCAWQKALHGCLDLLSARLMTVASGQSLITVGLCAGVGKQGEQESMPQLEIEGCARQKPFHGCLDLLSA